jgi:membrane associated rhomboid family serine protease
MSYTIILIIITALISLSAFNNNDLFDKLILWPTKISDSKEYYRLLTSGFIHQDYQHLIFNMLTLYFFGRNMEIIAGYMIGNVWLYLFMYLTGIIVSSLPSYYKNRNNRYYRSLGASGGVAAVLFGTIYYDPWGLINFFIPSILFAVLYLAYSVYMERRAGDNVNHDAHFWGSIYGFLMAFAIDPTHGRYFIEKLMHPDFL